VAPRIGMTLPTTLHSSLNQLRRRATEDVF
jgi:hypothetical protein